MAVLLGACGGVGSSGGGNGGGSPATGSNPNGQAGSATALAGRWFGPFPSDTGECGEAYGEFTFQSAGSYSFTTNSADCGGFTSLGNYQVQGDVIGFQQTGIPNCPTCQQYVSFSVRYSFINGALQMCDNVRCYTYYRQ